MSSILIVEDDPDIAQLIEHYLLRAGHAVNRLSTGTAVMPPNSASSARSSRMSASNSASDISGLSCS